MAIIGPFIESGIDPQILNEYDLQVKKARRIKSYIKLETNTGTFALKIAKISLNQAVRIVNINQYLSDNNFSIARINPNKYADPFIPINDGIVYLTDWIDGNELALNNKTHLLLLIKRMAEMHRLGFLFSSENVEYPFIDEIYLKKYWEERVDWLKNYNRKLKRKGSLSTFEHIFITYLPFIIDWSEKAIEQLNQWIIEFDSIKELRRTITHGKFHHRNAVITSNNNVFLFDFDHASIDTPIRDLAYFLRYYILNKEHRNWAKEWLEVYQEIVPLSEAEQRLLAIYLLFPERLINTVKRYYLKQSNLHEEEYLKKLQLRWEQMKEISWFVDQNHWLK